MRERRHCEAEVHDDRCDGWANSRDHFTPQSMVKRLHLDKRLLTSEDNLTWMNKYCHTLKDKPTAALIHQAILQARGRMIKFGEHIT